MVLNQCYLITRDMFIFNGEIYNHWRIREKLNVIGKVHQIARLPELISIMVLKKRSVLVWKGRFFNREPKKN